MAKAIKYADMDAEKKVKAERWAESWGAKPEDCPMIQSGLIITNRKDVSHLTDEDYDILCKDYVEKFADITDEVRELYRSEVARLKADNLPKVRLR